MTERELTYPWVEDPDAPGDIQVMSEDEADAAAESIAESYPDLVKLPPTPKMLAKMTISAWAKHFVEKDRALIDNTIRNGVMAGRDSTEIARQVIGSLQLNGVDGTTEIIRQQILKLARVAIAPRKRRE